MYKGGRASFCVYLLVYSYFLTWNPSPVTHGVSPLGPHCSRCRQSFLPFCVCMCGSFSFIGEATKSLFAPESYYVLQCSYGKKYLDACVLSSVSQLDFSENTHRALLGATKYLRWLNVYRLYLESVVFMDFCNK